jgi:hypothetical protein
MARAYGSSAHLLMKRELSTAPFTPEKPRTDVLAGGAGRAPGTPGSRHLRPSPGCILRGLRLTKR